jgi:hypothetical protein
MENQESLESREDLIAILRDTILSVREICELQKERIAHLEKKMKETKLLCNFNWN